MIETMDSTQIEILLASLRHLLTAIGGILVAKGYTDSSTVEAIAGSLVAIIGVLLSIHAKIRVASVVSNLRGQIFTLQSPPGSPITPSRPDDTGR